MSAPSAGPETASTEATSTETAAKPVTPPTAVERAIRQYLQHLSVERGLARNTLQSYERDLNRYARFLAAEGLREPQDIERGHVSAFAQALHDGADGGTALGVRSAARTIVAVRGLHKFWALEGLTVNDPAHEVRPPMPGKRLPKAIPFSEVERILEAAVTDTPAGLRDAALLEFLYSTGAR
ncbi:MAG: site-specific integrase, partial [Arthrobacter sp.]|nr:site-specific integrase [Arthrobacter sp.]